tara:strand:- start:9419 stop:9604 length:186 start_codon:yes stop_codon:yes gene_type:complete
LYKGTGPRFGAGGGVTGGIGPSIIGGIPPLGLNGGLLLGGICEGGGIGIWGIGGGIPPSGI